MLINTELHSNIQLPKPFEKSEWAEDFDILVKIHLAVCALKEQIKRIDETYFYPHLEYGDCLEKAYFLDQKSPLQEEVECIKELAQMTFVKEIHHEWTRVCKGHQELLEESVEAGPHLNERAREKVDQLIKEYAKKPELQRSVFKCEKITNAIFQNCYEIKHYYLHVDNSPKCTDPFIERSFIKTPSVSQYLDSFEQKIKEKKLDRDQEWQNFVDAVFRPLEFNKMSGGTYVVA